jgi:hypothetical protein
MRRKENQTKRIGRIQNKSSKKIRAEKRLVQQAIRK